VEQVKSLIRESSRFELFLVRGTTVDTLYRDPTMRVAIMSITSLVQCVRHSQQPSRFVDLQLRHSCAALGNRQPEYSVSLTLLRNKLRTQGDFETISRRVYLY
jgi:hypothetical protein